MLVDSITLADLDGDGQKEILGGDLNADIGSVPDGGALYLGRLDTPIELIQTGEQSDLLGIALFPFPAEQDGLLIVEQENTILRDADCNNP